MTRTEKRATAGRYVYVGVYEGGTLVRIFSVYRRSDLGREQRRSLWRRGKPVTLTTACAMTALGAGEVR